MKVEYERGGSATSLKYDLSARWIKREEKLIISLKVGDTETFVFENPADALKLAGQLLNAHAQWKDYKEQ